jgi:hypothetical protein
MAFVPHTDNYHVYVRRRVMAMLKIALISKVGAKDGHKVTIRFTQDWAWAECFCGWSGMNWAESSLARHQGFVHLFDEGLDHLDSIDGT